jgi:hypothetical protein
VATAVSQYNSYLRADSQRDAEAPALFIVLPDPSPRALLVTGALSLILLAVSLRQKLG